ncbi:ThiF family adenylyltransferase [Fimbriiglobus ruber]|uniref:ThiF family adenylyltransferase n=1 Tax=Fimbriiglobus ruber TaxID=1908690 RepID=UPI000B4AD9E7|nr:ThiF family adenylyltransferase [Fimbriiglobus ruber]
MMTKLRLSGVHHHALRDHLLPADGLEAVAIAFCGRRQGGDHHVLTVHDLVMIPHDACTERTPIRVSWPTSMLIPHLERAIRRGHAVLKIHSHRGDFRFFSEVDDVSDRNLFHSVYGWFDGNAPHASAVMLPDGEIFGRVVTDAGRFAPLHSVAVAGHDFHFWPGGNSAGPLPIFTQRHAQIFGQGTTARLRMSTAAVIGCSGTGSPLIEQLVRLGIGRLLLVDPDVVEEKNLNRILHSTMEDAKARRPKVEVMAREINRIGLGTEVIPLQKNLVDSETVRRVAQCDVVFGCMDGAEGRNLLNRLATFYCLPYFDVGVRLEADGQGGVSQVCGGVHYLQPGGSSLLSRGVISSEDIEAEALRRSDPVEYERRFKVGYIRGVREDRPAVVSVNMHFASMAVNEFLARLHPFRDDPNEDYAWVSTSLTQMHNYAKPDGVACARLARHVGRGDTNPLLDMPILGQ